jgi:hypothetical protein
MFNWLTFGRESDDSYKTNEKAADRLYRQVEEEFHYMIPQIDLEGIIKELLLFTKNRVITLQNLKKIFLHHMDEKTTDNLLKIISYPFFGKKDKANRKNNYTAYRDFNIKLLALDFFKEYNYENVKIINHPINQAIDNELETLYVIFFLIIYTRSDHNIKLLALFDILDYTKHNGLMSGCKYFTTAFRKFITIQLILPDILLNVRIFENRPSDDEQGNNYMFKFKKYLFFLKESSNLIKKFSNFLSHNLIFYEAISNKKINYYEFYKLCEKRNFDILFPRNIRHLLVTYLENDQMAITTKLFMNEYTKIISFYEKKSRGTDTITSTNEDIIRELHLMKDFIHFEEILSNEANFKFIIENEKYRKKLDQENLLQTPKDKIKKPPHTFRQSFLLPGEIALLTPNTSIEKEKTLSRSTTNKFMNNILPSIGLEPNEETSKEESNAIVRNPKKCLTVNLKKMNHVKLADRFTFNQINEEDEKKPELELEPEAVVEHHTKPELEVTHNMNVEDFFDSLKVSCNNSIELIKKTRINEYDEDAQEENMIPSMFIDTIIDSVEDFSLFEIKEEQQSEYMYYAEVEQGLLDPKTYELKKNKPNFLSKYLSKKRSSTNNSPETRRFSEAPSSTNLIVLKTEDSQSIVIPEIKISVLGLESPKKQLLKRSEKMRIGEENNDSLGIIMPEYEKYKSENKFTINQETQPTKGTLQDEAQISVSKFKQSRENILINHKSDKFTSGEVKTNQDLEGVFNNRLNVKARESVCTKEYIKDIKSVKEDTEEDIQDSIKKGDEIMDISEDNVEVNQPDCSYKESIAVSNKTIEKSYIIPAGKVDSRLFEDKTHTRILFNIENSIDLTIEMSRTYLIDKREEEMFVFEVEGPEDNKAEDHVHRPKVRAKADLVKKERSNKQLKEVRTIQRK